MAPDTSRRTSLTWNRDDGIVVVVDSNIFLTDRPTTVEDYLGGRESNRHVELVFGVLREPAAPSWCHQDIVARLLIALRTHVDEHRLGTVVASPVDVVLDANQHLVVQPDLCFVCEARKGIVRDQVWGAPDLTVEVLSFGSRGYDQRTKRAWYREYGVREYWVIDPVGQDVTVHDLTSGTPLTFDVNQSIRSGVLPRLRLRVARIFAS